MDRETEARWRAALVEKGMDNVRAQLDMKPGRPDELCFDVGDQPPYPTRAFLEDWCRGKPPRSIGLSGSTTMVIAMSLLVVVCIIRMIGSFSPSEKNWLSDGAVPYRAEGGPNARGALPQPGATNSTAVSSAGNVGPAGDDRLKNASMITTSEQSSERASCSAVSSAGNLKTVQSLSACSKLGSGAEPASKK